MAGSAVAGLLKLYQGVKTVTKKSVLITILLIVILSCAFASSFSVELKASPYSFQYVKGDDIAFKSKYGFGFETGLRFNVKDAVCMGINVKYSNYRYDELPDNYQVLSSFMPYIGCMQNINDKWSITADLGFGIQQRMIGDARDFFFGVNLYLGTGYAVSEKISVTLGADFGLCYQSGSSDSSADVMLGARFEL